MFAFCLAVKAYNAVSLVRAALRSKLVEELSWYHMCSETARTWSGMETAIPAEEWGGLIDDLSDSSFAKLLRGIVRRMNISKYKKSRRGPKKPRPP